MFSTYPVLSARGLLTAMVATLLSGQALADVAGRVNFVTGDVAAIGADGSRRVLSRGDQVLSGDRLETNKGRVQIRFTDGSFVSLQPNTVFGLDNYTFARNKPEEGSLLFNFIRGGMRTVSGAIGKVNRANYKVKTPVATIGIRGTGYAGSLNNGVLVVSVSKGMVNLANEFGNSNVPAGQTFQTRAGTAPEPAPAGVTAQARADAPSDEQQQQQSEEGRDERQPVREDVASGGSEGPSTTTSAPAVIAGIDNVVERLDGTDLGNGGTQEPPPPLSTTLANSTFNGSEPSPSYTVAHTLAHKNAIDGDFEFLVSDHFAATFNQSSDSERGALQRLSDAFGTYFDAGPASSSSRLKTVNVTTVGKLSFGEWTNGSASIVDLHLSELALGANEFQAYIIGQAPSSTATLQGLKVGYSLGAHSTPRSGLSSGTLDKFNINLDFVNNLLDVDLQLTMNGVTGNAVYVAQKNGIDLGDGLISGGTFQTELGDLTATSAQDPLCAQGCDTVVSGFLANTNGEQIGASYYIDRTGAPISGVAELVRTGTAVPVLTPNTTTPTNSARFVTNTASGVVIDENAISATFDPFNGALAKATTSRGTVYGPAIGDGAATTLDIGHYNKTLAWGVWLNGDVNYNGTLTPVLGEGIHYIIGAPTATIPANLGTVTYRFVGGTAPTATPAASGGTVVSLYTGSVLSTSQLSVDFNTATTNLSLDLGGFDSALLNAGNTIILPNTPQVSLTGTGQLSGSNLVFDTNNLNVSVLGVSCDTCSGFASGFVAGNSAQYAGLSYQANLVASPTPNLPDMTGAVISGAAAFEKVNPL